MKRQTVGFILEQTLGHVTHSQNLMTNVPNDKSIEPVWGLIDWETRGLANNVPLYKSNWTVRAGLRARRKIAQIQRKTPLDALFIHTQVAAVLATKWIKRLPTIVSLDATPVQYDGLGEHYAHARGNAWIEDKKWRLNYECFRHAYGLVTWSNWAKESLVHDYQVPADKVTVIPPGVNTADWRSPRQRSPTEKTVRILFVGGDLQRKGGQLLLEAFRELRKESSAQGSRDTSRLELHLVTRDRLPTEPDVHVYNQMEPNSVQLKKLFQSCDIFCLPTHGDCLPMVLMEAGATGLPMVATQVGAIDEIVKDGETGCLIPNNDLPALVAALRLLVNSPEARSTFGTQASEWVRQNFDAERNAQRLLELIKQSISEASRCPTYC